MSLGVVNGWWTASPFADRPMVSYPAHPSNYYADRACKPIALVWHEPQERADNYESTPVYFASPNRDASTTYYGDSDGDLYQLVPLDRAPIANGLKNRPLPRFSDGGPEFGAYSLNMQTHSVEVEGYTATIQQTMTQAQYQGCVDLAVLTMVLYDLPRNPLRVGLAHSMLADDRSDGTWIATKSGIPQEATNRVLKIERDINELKALAAAAALRLNGADKRFDGQEALLTSILPPLVAGNAALAEQRLRYIYRAANRPYPS